MDEIRSFIDTIRKANKRPNYKFYEYLVSHSNNFSEVVWITNELISLGMSFSKKTFKIMLDTAENFEDTKYLIDLINKYDIKIDSIELSILIGITSNSNEAEFVLNALKDKNVEFAPIVYLTLMEKQTTTTEAKKIFLHMKELGYEMHKNIYHWYLSIMDISKLDTEILDEMEQQGINFDIDLYNTFQENSSLVRRKEMRILLNNRNKEVKIDDLINELRTKKLASTFKKENMINYPLSSFSWTVHSPSVFYKNVDKSILLHNGSAIPMDIRSFFSLNDLKKGERTDAKLFYKDSAYSAYFEKDIQKNPRTYIKWYSDFSRLLNEELVEWHNRILNSEVGSERVPQLRFEIKDVNQKYYFIQIIYPNGVELDTEEYENDTQQDEEIATELDKNIFSRISLVSPPDKEIYKERSKTKYIGKKIDYNKKYHSSKEIGDMGEDFVVEYEKERLAIEGRKDLADKVEQKSVTEGDGLGYDILSYTKNSQGFYENIYIEVKTTTGSINKPFNVTWVEMEFSKDEKYKNQYFLYRVFNFNRKMRTGNLYIERGSLSDNFNCYTSEYVVSK